MATLGLKLHPDFKCDAARAVSVDIAHTSDGLALTYRIDGHPAGIMLPAATEPAQVDGLWNSTCLEIFLQNHGETGYAEFNFSPSRQWAGYTFNGHRIGMQALATHPPEITTKVMPNAVEVRVTLRTKLSAGMTIGLSAVIEEKNGNKSYWALAHPPGKADFHHQDCFAFQLEAADFK